MTAGNLIQFETNDEWNGRVAIIDYIENNIAFAYCIYIPYTHYKIYLDNPESLRNVRIIATE